MNLVKFVPVKNGQHAIIDEKNFEDLAKYKWHLSANGYCVRTQKKTKTQPKTVYMHRQIMSYPPSPVDHRDHDKTDNREVNLRICSNADNCRNNRLSKRNTSGYKGVTWHKKGKKWNAEIIYFYKKIFLGLHTSKIEAAKAYNEAATRLYGEFACLNEVPK